MIEIVSVFCIESSGLNPYVFFRSLFRPLASQNWHKSRPGLVRSGSSVFFVRRALFHSFWPRSQIFFIFSGPNMCVAESVQKCDVTLTFSELQLCFFCCGLLVFGSRPNRFVEFWLPALLLVLPSSFKFGMKLVRVYNPSFTLAMIFCFWLIWALILLYGTKLGSRYKV